MRAHPRQAPLEVERVDEPHTRCPALQGPACCCRNAVPGTAMSCPERMHNHGDCPGGVQFAPPVEVILSFDGHCYPVERGNVSGSKAARLFRPRWQLDELALGPFDHRVDAGPVCGVVQGAQELDAKRVVDEPVQRAVPESPQQKVRATPRLSLLPLDLLSDQPAQARN